MLFFRRRQMLQCAKQQFFVCSQPRVVYVFSPKMNSKTSVTNLFCEIWVFSNLVKVITSIFLMFIICVVIVFLQNANKNGRLFFKNHRASSKGLFIVVDEWTGWKWSAVCLCFAEEIHSHAMCAFNSLFRWSVIWVYSRFLLDHFNIVFLLVHKPLYLLFIDNFILHNIGIIFVWTKSIARIGTLLRTQKYTPIESLLQCVCVCERL